MESFDTKMSQDHILMLCWIGVVLAVGFLALVMWLR